MPATSPTSGRPSRDCGRAQARVATIRVSRSPGRKRLPRSTSSGAMARGSGSKARKVEPMVTTLPAAASVKMLGVFSADSGRAVAASLTGWLTLSTRSSSTTWRGGDASSSCAVAPQVATIGCQRPDGSRRYGLHGPAAMSTRSAARGRRPSRTTPTARPFTTAGTAAAPSSSCAPASRARRAMAAVAAWGGMGKPVSSRVAQRSSASDGSSDWTWRGARRSDRSPRGGSSPSGSRRVGSGVTIRRPAGSPGNENSSSRWLSSR